MLRIFHIGLSIGLGCFLLKTFTSPSREAVGCALLPNVLNDMR
jgi:hypothetical protein